MHFDKKIYKLLKAIYRSGDDGILWGKLRQKFGDDGLHETLDLLGQEQYIANKDSSGQFLPPEHQHFTSDDFRAFCTPKGGEFIYNREIAFRRWLIPSVISVIAILVSVASFVLTLTEK